MITPRAAIRLHKFGVSVDTLEEIIAVLNG